MRQVAFTSVSASNLVSPNRTAHGLRRRSDIISAMDPLGTASAALKAADAGNRLWSAIAVVLSVLTVVAWCLYGIDGRPGVVLQDLLRFLGVPEQAVSEAHAWLIDSSRRDTLIKVTTACLALLLSRAAWLRWESAHEFDEFMNRPGRPDSRLVHGVRMSVEPEVIAAWERSNQRKVREYSEISAYLSHRFYASWATAWILVALLAECGAVHALSAGATVGGYFALLFIGGLIAYGGLVQAHALSISTELLVFIAGVLAVPALLVVRVIQFATGEFSWQPRPQSDK